MGARKIDGDEWCCRSFASSLLMGKDVEHDEGCPDARRDQRDDLEAWTLVQSPDARASEDNLFMVEAVKVRNPYLAQRILDRGGYVFDTEREADEASLAENFPPDYEGCARRRAGDLPRSVGHFDHSTLVDLGKTQEPVYVFGYTNPKLREAALQVLGEGGGEAFGLIEFLHAVKETAGGGGNDCLHLLVRYLAESGALVLEGESVRPC